LNQIVGHWIKIASGVRICSGIAQFDLPRADTIDGLKLDMVEGRFRFADSKISGWRDGAYDFYIGEGHHRINAALEIYWETREDRFITLLLEHGKWHRSKPLLSRRLPTRSLWFKLTRAIGW
jgi:filamentous hemagglutinin